MDDSTPSGVQGLQHVRTHSPSTAGLTVHSRSCGRSRLAADGSEIACLWHRSPNGVVGIWWPSAQARLKRPRVQEYPADRLWRPARPATDDVSPRTRTLVSTLIANIAKVVLGARRPCAQQETAWKTAIKSSLSLARSDLDWMRKIYLAASRTLIEDVNQCSIRHRVFHEIVESLHRLRMRSCRTFSSRPRLWSSSTS